MYKIYQIEKDSDTTYIGVALLGNALISFSVSKDKAEEEEIYDAKAFESQLKNIPDFKTAIELMLHSFSSRYGVSIETHPFEVDKLEFDKLVEIYNTLNCYKFFESGSVHSKDEEFLLPDHDNFIENKEPEPLKPLMVVPKNTPFSLEYPTTYFLTLSNIRINEYWDDNNNHELPEKNIKPNQPLGTIKEITIKKFIPDSEDPDEIVTLRGSKKEIELNEQDIYEMEFVFSEWYSYKVPVVFKKYDNTFAEFEIKGEKQGLNNITYRYSYFTLKVEFYENSETLQK